MLPIVMLFLICSPQPPFYSVPLDPFLPLPVGSRLNCISGRAHASRHTILLGSWHGHVPLMPVKIMQPLHNKRFTIRCLLQHMWRLEPGHGNPFTLPGHPQPQQQQDAATLVLKWRSPLIRANSLIRIQQVSGVEETDIGLGPSIRAKWQMVLAVARQEVALTQ